MEEETRTHRRTRERPARPRHHGPAIIVGIDFGTTYSGVAWALSTKPDQISIVTNWASQHYNSTDKEKSPSAISYKSNDEVSCWGFNIPSGSISLKWFKLCLLDEDDLPEHIRNCSQIREAQAQLREMNRHVTEVIADYLRELWEHSLQNIERDVGKSLLDLSTLKVIFTIPAIWPAYAQARMERAIEAAGILDLRSAGDTVLTFVSEPEAAACATLDDLAGRATMKPQDHFVVCDAGGGTVDIITYMVASTSPLTIRESIKGDGKLCGSVFLDENFTKLLQKLIPPLYWSKLGTKGINSIMNIYWENGIKPQFCDDGQRWEISLPFGGTIQDHLHLPHIGVEAEHVRNIFKPVVGEVTELVQRQIQGLRKKHAVSPKFVVLVGGFGRSRHLHNCIVEAIGNGIEVLQSAGARPWTAVCRGAVIRGLTEGHDNIARRFVVDSRVARASYGTVFNMLPWEAGSHDVRDKEWCPVTRHFLAKDQTRWFVHTGDQIDKDQPIVHSFWQEISRPDEEIVTELIYSTNLEPPSRCDETVKVLCTVRWSKIPHFEKLPSWKNSAGKEYRTVHYDIKMMANGVSLDFEIYHDGKVMASKNVAVDFDTSGSIFNRPMNDRSGHVPRNGDDDDEQDYVEADEDEQGDDDTDDDEDDNDDDDGRFKKRRLHY